MASFLFIFGLFKQQQNNLYNKLMRKMSISSSVWCRDSNPRPLDQSHLPLPLDQGSVKLVYIALFQHLWQAKQDDQTRYKLILSFYLQNP